VTRRDEGASVEIVELMPVPSWDHWVDMRGNSDALKPVSASFERLGDPTTVRTLFKAHIGSR
jgi:hypothetical protein